MNERPLTTWNTYLCKKNKPSKDLEIEGNFFILIGDMFKVFQVYSYTNCLLETRDSETGKKSHKNLCLNTSEMNLGVSSQNLYVETLIPMWQF